MAALAADVAENDHLIAAQFFQSEGQLVVLTAREDSRLGYGTTRSSRRDYGGLPPTLSATRVLARWPERCDRCGNRQNGDCAHDKDGREPSHSRRLVRRYGGGKSREGRATASP
jgi:hypothetical protein